MPSLRRTLQTECSPEETARIGELLTCKRDQGCTFESQVDKGDSCAPNYIEIDEI